MLSEQSDQRSQVLSLLFAMRHQKGRLLVEDLQNAGDLTGQRGLEPAAEQSQHTRLETPQKRDLCAVVGVHEAQEFVRFEEVSEPVEAREDVWLGLTTFGGEGRFLPEELDFEGEYLDNAVEKKDSRIGVHDLD